MKNKIDLTYEKEAVDFICDIAGLKIVKNKICNKKGIQSKCRMCGKLITRNNLSGFSKNGVICTNITCLIKEYE